MSAVELVEAGGADEEPEELSDQEEALPPILGGAPSSKGKSVKGEVKDNDKQPKGLMNFATDLARQVSRESGLGEPEEENTSASSKKGGGKNGSIMDFAKGIARQCSHDSLHHFDTESEASRANEDEDDRKQKPKKKRFIADDVSSDAGSEPDPSSQSSSKHGASNAKPSRPSKRFVADDEGSELKKDRPKKKPVKRFVSDW